MRMAYKIEKRTCWDCIPFASVGNSSLMQTCRAASHCVAKLNQEIQMYLYNHSTSLFCLCPYGPGAAFVIVHYLILRYFIGLDDMHE